MDDARCVTAIALRAELQPDISSDYMSAYLINYVRVRDGIPSQEGLAQVKRTVETYGGRWHPPGEEQRLNCARAILLEFRSMTEAENWYNSCEYKDISHVYVDTSIDLLLVDGVSPDFTMAGFAPMGDC